VVFSPADEPAARLDALCAWVDGFEAARGRRPALWVAPLCADPALSRVALLAETPVYLARSRRLLLLAGPRLLESFWAAVECFAWQALGGTRGRRADAVDVARCAGGGGVGADAVGADAAGDPLADAFDLFDVLYTPAVEAGHDVHRRLLRAVEHATSTARCARSRPSSRTRRQRARALGRSEYGVRRIESVRIQFGLCPGQARATHAVLQNRATWHLAHVLSLRRAPQPMQHADATSREHAIRSHAASMEASSSEANALGCAVASR
jgi:hypothetical protein